MRNYKTALLTGACLAMAMSAAPAWAQSAAPTDEATEVLEVVVTAQKREERLQDVPVAVSVASGDQLEQQNIGNIDQLKLIVPSFESTAFGVSIRGVGTSTFSTSIEPTVSTVLDGVVLGRPEMALGSFYDLERVEILRGPQGMLFGKNASSGVVSIVSKNPRLGQFGFAGNFNLGEDGYNKSDATVNIPIGETAAIRVGGFVNKADGVLHNQFDGRDFNGNDEWGARAKLLWRPTDSLDILVTADYAKQDQSITWSPYATVPGGTTETALALCGVTASPSNTDLCIDGDQFKDRENYGFAAQVNYEFGGGYTLTSITAGRRDFDFSSGDSDSLPVNILNTNLSNQDIRQVSQELRLASPVGERFEYVAGLYYFKMTTDQTTVQTGTFGLAPIPIVNQTIDNHVVTESRAIFGQGTFNATEQLRFIVGGRFTRDNISLEFDQYALPGFISPGATVSTSMAAEETNFSWRLGVQYDLTPVTMVYATASKGYKGPGFNQTAVSSATQSQYVGPEYPMSYELGLKTVLPGGKGILNVAIFDTKFEDYQAQTVDFSVTPASFRTINAGDLKTRGVEVDLTLAPIDGLVLTAAGAWLDAKYGKFGYISCYPGQPVGPGECEVVVPAIPPFLPAVMGYDPSGQSLAGAPEWKVALSGKYQRPITENFEGFVQADYNWRSDVNASAAGDPATKIDAYGILSGSIGVETADGRWRVSIWGKNLTDEQFPSALFGTVFGAPGDYSQVLTGDAFRRFGVALNVRY
jgi:iron complex outermembrane receptor protein